MSGTFGLQWHITNRCDQRCKHCYIFNSGKAVATSDFPMAMVDDTLDKFVIFCTAYQKRPALAITGGDPLLHPEFWQLIQKVYARDISFSILGNPFHITVDIMQRLRDYGCRAYQMSLDGLEQTHDMFRRPGSYQATISKVRELVNAGFAINIMSTVSAKNYQEIPELARVVNDLGVNVFAFARYCPTHRDTSDMLSPTVYRDFLDTMWRTYQSLQPSKTQFNLKDHLWTPYLVEKGLLSLDGTEDDVVYAGCNCGISHLTLLDDGAVYACRRFESPLGNIFESNFEELFFSNKMDIYRKVESIDGCKDCRLLNYCRGCRAVAFGATGDYCARDPQCWLACQSAL